MKLSLDLVLALVASTASALPAISQHDVEDATWPWRIPTVHETAVQARRILSLANEGTLTTIFPKSAANNPDVPEDVIGSAVSLAEYFGNCGTDDYNPTLIGVTIATMFRNAAHGSNATFSLHWKVPEGAPKPDDPLDYSPANLQRMSLIGTIERVDPKRAEKEGLRECFIKAHPESHYWAPGGDIHESWWAKLIVREIYWFGGFGDRARIGWIPIEEFHNVTREEIDDCRLMGEKGYGTQCGGRGKAKETTNVATVGDAPKQVVIGGGEAINAW